MKTGIIAGMLLFLLSSTASASLKFGESAPAFSLSDREGREFHLGDAVGPASKGVVRGVIVTFFASWCVPCRNELPVINALVREYAGKGVIIVLVNERETDTVINNLMKELQVEQPIVLGDHDGKVADQYGVRFLPTTYFIGADGKIKDVIFGEIKDAYEFRKSAGALLN